MELRNRGSARASNCLLPLISPTRLWRGAFLLKQARRERGRSPARPKAQSVQPALSSDNTPATGLFWLQFSRVKLEIDGKNDFRANVTLAALPCHLRAVSYVDRIAVTVWATPVSAQNVDHLKTIGTKPLTLIHLLHFPAPFAPSLHKAETRDRLAHPPRTASRRNRNFCLRASAI
jgi:hypothetical protein